MLSACGNAVYGRRTNLWVLGVTIHKAFSTRRQAMGKLAAFTQLCSQLSTKICTLFTQDYKTSTSAACTLYTQSTGPIYRQSKLNKGLCL